MLGHHVHNLRGMRWVRIWPRRNFALNVVTDPISFDLSFLLVTNHISFDLLCLPTLKRRSSTCNANLCWEEPCRARREQEDEEKCYYSQLACHWQKLRRTTFFSSFCGDGHQMVVAKRWGQRRKMRLEILLITYYKCDLQML